MGQVKPENTPVADESIGGEAKPTSSSPKLDDVDSTATIVKDSLVLTGVHLLQLYLNSKSTSFVGNHSTSELAAHSVTMNIVVYASFVFFMVVFGVTGRLRADLSAGKKDKAAARINLGIAFSLGAGFITALLLWLATGPLFRLFDVYADAEETFWAERYFPIRLIGVPFYIAATALGGVWQGLGNMRSYAVIIGSMSVVNLLAWAVAYRVPDSMIAEGSGRLVLAGWLSITVEICACILGLIAMYRPASAKPLGLYRARPETSLIASFLSDSGYIVWKGIMYMVAAFATPIIAGNLGKADISAYHIVLVISVYCPYLCDALGIVANIQTAHAIARKDLPGLRRIVKIAIRTSLAVGLFFFTILFLGTNHFVHSSTHDPLVVDRVASLWPIVLGLQFVFAASGIVEGLLFGAGAFGWMAAVNTFGLFCVFVPIQIIGWNGPHNVAWVFLGLVGMNVNRVIGCAIQVYRLVYRVYPREWVGDGSPLLSPNP